MNRFSDSSLLHAKPKWLIQCVADLARHEGFREFAYPDPRSKLAKVKARWGFQPAELILARIGANPKDGLPWTVGYGFTRGVKPSNRISKQAADKLLEKEIVAHLHVVDTLFPKWKEFPLAVQTVVVNMAYNMGIIRLGKFVPTIALFNSGDYDGAAARLRRTAWYKQVGPRAEELCRRLETLQIDSKHKVI